MDVVDSGNYIKSSSNISVHYSKVQDYYDEVQIRVGATISQTSSDQGIDCHFLMPVSTDDVVYSCIVYNQTEYTDVFDNIYDSILYGPFSMLITYNDDYSTITLQSPCFMRYDYTKIWAEAMTYTIRGRGRGLQFNTSNVGGAYQIYGVHITGRYY